MKLPNSIFIYGGRIYVGLAVISPYDIARDQHPDNVLPKKKSQRAFMKILHEANISFFRGGGGQFVAGVCGCKT